MAHKIAPTTGDQIRFGISSGAGAATAQTVTPCASGNPLATDDKLRMVWNVTDHTVVDPSTVTISDENEITIVGSTSSKKLLISWHDVAN